MTPIVAAPAKAINVSQAKTQLSALLAEVECGRSFTLARSGKPIARLVPLQPRRQRQLGFDPGPVEDAVLDPLTEAELEDWGL